MRWTESLATRTLYTECLAEDYEPGYGDCRAKSKLVFLFKRVSYKKLNLVPVDEAQPLNVRFRNQPNEELMQRAAGLPGNWCGVSLWRN